MTTRGRRVGRLEQRIAQFNSTMDQQPVPTLSQVGSLALTEAARVNMRMIEMTQVLNKEELVPELVFSSSLPLSLLPVRVDKRVKTYKNPNENIKTVTIFCFLFILNFTTHGSGSAKITKSVNMDMMDEKSHSGYVLMHLPSIAGAMTAMGMQVTARRMSCVTVQMPT